MEILVDRYVLYDIMYFISNAVCSMPVLYLRHQRWHFSHPAAAIPRLLARRIEVDHTFLIL